MKLSRTMAPVILPDPPDPPEPMGLIAAGGRLPMLVAEGMRRRGHSVHCAGLAGQYPPELPSLCAKFREVGVLKVTRWAKILRGFGVRYAVMVGRVDKAALMASWRAVIRNAPDLPTARMWFKLRNDRRSHLLLARIADYLADEGILLIDSTTHIPDHLATPGAMTERHPTPGQKADIELGWPLLQEIVKLDIGQAIAVREGDVVAVEAIEGTDRMIERAGELCRSKPWTLMKTARAGHDRRSDVPTIGPVTIERLAAGGGRCLAVAAGEVIVIDRAETIALADKLGVCLVGVAAV
ncbi:MAG: UDP-2,3-diacylglucosamine diphosphatase LpxI [Planctomycetota bacterium]